MSPKPAIWFPTVRTGTGTDVFTERLCESLNAMGIHAKISWLPHRAEYAPWSVRVPELPSWANVVHVNTWLSPRFIAPNVPVVATLHHSVHDPLLRPYKGWARAAYHKRWIVPRERLVMRRAQRVVAVSRFVAEMAQQTLCDMPLDVVYNGVDIGLFQPGNRQRQPDEPFRLLFVGGWMARKGVDLLAPIMRDLGDGFTLSYTGGLASKKEKTRFPPNMHDIGRLSADGVMTAMRESDAFLFPSRSEGLPLVAIEAMACGLPVIATRGSSMVEVVEEGVTGLLCDQDDSAAFARAARRLAGGQSEALGKAGRTSVAARFSSHGMVDAYVRIYNELVSGVR